MALRLELESPLPATRARGVVVVRGWTVDGDGVPASVELRVGGERVARVPVGERRSDVVRAAGLARAQLRCGFSAVLGVARDGVEIGELEAVVRGGGDEVRVPRRFMVHPVTARAGLDEPGPLRSGGAVPVAGWVQAPGDAVLGVAASCGGEARALAFGFARPDREQGAVGFAGTVPVETAGADLELIVRLASGAKLALRREVDLVPAPAPRAVLGRVARPDLLFADAAAVTGVRVDGAARVVREAAGSVSIVVPCHGAASETARCLDALSATLPAALRAEILAVDDASPDATWEVLSAAAARDERIEPVRNPENLGFLRTVNQAAARARGDVLVHVNDDCEPQPGWLAPLLDALDGEAGIAGGRLVHPDGTLQESGGIILENGASYTVGRGLDPDHPLLQHIREVDYVSFALAALRRTTWQALGGFDEAFLPAYYEDVDLAFRARSHGWRTFVVPESAALHHEGASGMAEPGSGDAPPNRDRFVARWGEQLAGHPPLTERLDDAYLHAVVPYVRPWRPLPRAVVACGGHGDGFARAFALHGALRDAGWWAFVLAAGPVLDEDARQAAARAGVPVVAGPLTVGPRVETERPHRILPAAAADVALLVAGAEGVAGPLLHSFCPTAPIVVDEGGDARAIVAGLPELP